MLDKYIAGNCYCPEPIESKLHIGKCQCGGSLVDKKIKKRKKKDEF